MPDRQNPRLCRDFAEEARIKAYLELAEDYETLAQTLERIQRKRRLLEPT